MFEQLFFLHVHDQGACERIWYQQEVEQKHRTTIFGDVCGNYLSQKPSSQVFCPTVCDAKNEVGYMVLSLVFIRISELEISPGQT
jgi:hypothetical protein